MDQVLGVTLLAFSEGLSGNFAECVLSTSNRALCPPPHSIVLGFSAP